MPPSYFHKRCRAIVQNRMKVKTPTSVGEMRTLDDAKSQIRLLRFHPKGSKASRRDLIRLEFWRTDDAPPYAAISYTWGPEFPQKLLPVSGEMISVRLNSWYAIKQAYEEGSFMHVWIDSICVDQTNLEEKAHQVRLMSSIYRNAVYVLVSLEPVSDRFSAICRRIRAFEGNPSWAAWEGAHHPGSHHQDGFNAISNREHILNTWRHSSEGRQRAFDEWGKQLRGISLLPYWCRLWIVQELSLAGAVRLMFGSYVIHWRSLCSFYTFYVLWGNGMPCGLPSVLATSAGATPERRSLHEVLEAWSHQKCSDPRDRVYGLLSLVDWPERLGPITADYTKSVLALAAETLKYEVRCYNILRIMKCEALEHNLDQQLLLRREGSMSTDSCLFPTRTEAHIDLDPWVCHRVTTNQHGQLFLPLHPKEYLEYGQKRSHLLPAEHPGHGSPYIVGDICYDAQADDLVAWHFYGPAVHSRQDVGLVLRKTPYTDLRGEVIYEIIGQCKLLIDYVQCGYSTHNCHCDDSDARVLRRERFPIHLHLDPMDAMVFEGQGLFESESDNKRIITRFCGTPWSSFATTPVKL
ncbi:unnamed protein product [Cercospora beticola]|nr:unnamed protein product [Cercospora beticola]